ncbi:MAG TPA: FIST N-terminal domain-containing protein [Candidatus Aquilonibacter sp.]|nr:FIST N-terminal domain-containing protein [Candidatus Aquilonibacter sp.]
MKTEQCQWSAEKGWEPLPSAGTLGAAAQVVLLFGGAKSLKQSRCLETVRKAYPNAHMFGCSTAGEIQPGGVEDETIALTAIAFELTKVATAQTRIESPARSFEAGKRLARQFDPNGLRHVFVLSEGLKVNASELVNGINSSLPRSVSTSGGCASDGGRMQTTHVWCDGEPEESAAVALGFYGDRLRVGMSAIGGWEPFGPDRLITKSKQNVLYEIDHRPALALYKKYLGAHARELPSSGKMFPLELCIGKQRVLRALIGVNEAEQSITFAGNVPEGIYARFMVGHVEDLIQGTRLAARESLKSLLDFQSQLSILVSCCGRRFVLKQRIEEEVEAVREALGSRVMVTGFYSYGEIAPVRAGGNCELHNETMTITSFSEI